MRQRGETIKVENKVQLVAMLKGHMHELQA